MASPCPVTSHRWWITSCRKYWHKRHHRELRSVRPEPAPVELIGSQGADPGDEGQGRGLELVGDDLRVLLGVPLLQGGHVLVPVGEGRLVLGQHQREPFVEQPVDVADVRAVLQRRPHRWLPAGRDGRAGAQDRHPLLGGHEGPLGHLVDRDLARGETALLAATAQGPGPVLGVRLRFHVRQASAHSPLAATAELVPPTPCATPEHRSRHLLRTSSEMRIGRQDEVRTRGETRRRHSLTLWRNRTSRPIGTSRQDSSHHVGPRETHTPPRPHTLFCPALAATMARCPST